MRKTPPPLEHRKLLYEALDPEWESCEFRKFCNEVVSDRHQAPYDAFLFGRFMQSDLHQSCRPALPPNVSKLNGATIQGMMILQVVDVANIGANYKHRTELSIAGPTRTLKLVLTDGHQLVFGFEFTPLLQFNVKVPRGTKIVLENVPIRHGLLLLTSDNCQLLETSFDQLGKEAKRPAASASGSYSAALVTSQFSIVPKTPPPSSPTGRQQIAAVPLVTTSSTMRNSPVTAKCSGISPLCTSYEPINTTASTFSESAVFVDVPSSDDDVDSDSTDPLVEYLFYSPNTPRSCTNTNEMEKGLRDSKKRRCSTSTERNVVVGSSLHQNGTCSTHATDKLWQVNNAKKTCPSLDVTHPFQYFQAVLPTLSAPEESTRFKIRACIKSVIGFQFNTGQYQLRVFVEDCTATKAADVAEAFVERLMGVPCSKFLQTMQTNLQLAHGLAATMQFTLMNLEGVMTFERRAATSAPESPLLLLVDCHDFHSCNSHELLHRVKELLPQY
ncbi:hypothetical protein PsorP6_019346 [Peronosclerospora sorghi]|nr:hypothetical protein PsorP6_019338 [Peronosclerospora sorghi]KAI9895503.1 hypothetical protein PsorP6_019346 [Peronosclerospora sorghi]